MSEDISFDHKKCIICQRDDPTKQPCIPTEIGKASMKRAADIRDDIVSKRMKFADDSGLDYVYHNLNDCFKGYVRATVACHWRSTTRSPPMVACRWWATDDRAVGGPAVACHWRSTTGCPTTLACRWWATYNRVVSGPPITHQWWSNGWLSTHGGKRLSARLL